MLKEDDYTNTIGHLHFTPIPAAAATDFVSSDLTNGGCLRSVGVGAGGERGRRRGGDGPTTNGVERNRRRQRSFTEVGQNRFPPFRWVQ